MFALAFFRQSVSFRCRFFRDVPRTLENAGFSGLIHIVIHIVCIHVDNRCKRYKYSTYKTYLMMVLLDFFTHTIFVCVDPAVFASREALETLAPRDLSTWFLFYVDKSVFVAEKPVFTRFTRVDNFTHTKIFCDGNITNPVFMQVHGSLILCNSFYAHNF